MDRRGAVGYVVLVGLMVLAGCAGGPVSVTDDGTPTATPIQTGETSGVTASPNGTFEVHNINVGQSSSTLFVGPTGETMLVDTWHFQDDGEYVLDYLRRHGIDRIDYPVVSHNDADLSGYTAEDGADQEYSFPCRFRPSAGAAVRLHSGDGTDSSTDLYWDNGWTWNNGGDTASLYEDSGTEVATGSYSGYVDIRVGTIHADGDGTLNDEWVEFDNHADSAPNMDDFHVEDDAGHTYHFEDAYTITADGTCRLHIGDGDSDRMDGDIYWDSSTIIWNNSGDTVYLYDDDGTLHDSKSY